MPSFDNTNDLLDLLKKDNIDYYLVTLIPQNNETNKIDIFTSLDDSEVKNLIKVIKNQLKQSEKSNNE